MSKGNNMPIPLEKIVDAARAAGFETELRVAGIAEAVGWRVSQNVYFVDKDERKGRELDLLLYRKSTSSRVKPEVTCMVTLCVEVKKTADPFIFYTSRKGYPDGSSGYGIFHWRNKVDHTILSMDDIERKRPLAESIRLARSYSSYRNGQTQHIQAGVISAFKAAIHERDNCSEVYSDSSGDICFFVPMVVVDGPLYECYYNSSGDDLIAEAVDHVVYRQNYHSDHYGQVSQSVYVITLSSFQSRLEEFRVWETDIGETLIRNRKK
ncbi:hypothetical protein, partial [Sphingomonas sp. Leaf62]|uniref:hypothetical protein n=1 Tax=Sphingomonas sp. Leaf62 TaxID=1736228 RepID=UPI001F375E43